MKKRNAFQLKLLMAGIMVLDHLSYLPSFLPTHMALGFHVLSRCVAVFFAYLAVEGFLYTHSRKKYLQRLFLAAGGMMLGNLLLSATGIGPTISNNIFLTLAMGVATLCIWFGDLALSKPARISIGIFITGLAMLLTEGGILIIPFMVLTYKCYSSPRLRNLAYFLLALVLFAMSYQSYPTLHDTLTMLAYNSDFLFITVIPVLTLYSGERGPATAFSKYFFYVFYPAHLWLIALLAHLMGG